MTVGPLHDFLTERARVIDERPFDRWTEAGTSIAERLTGCLDEAIRNLAGTDSSASVIAIGGYGRSELCLQSDVDLMILHDGQLPADWVQAVLYPLWDARLKVGHSVRTPKEVASAARDNIETLTSLVGARLLAGPSDRWQETVVLLKSLFRRERDWILAALKAEERQRRSAEPVRLLAANVKTGRGGLRSLNSIGWERAALALTTLLPTPSTEERDAQEVLLAVRNAIHAVTGKANDTYEPDVRIASAEWLGAEPEEVGYQLYASIRSVEAMVDERWPDLLDEVTDPIRSAGRWLVRSVRRGGASGDHGAMSIVSAALSRTSGRVFDGIEELKLRNAPTPMWTQEDRQTLVRMVAAPERGHRIADRLHRLGYLERLVPELAATYAMPQSAPFHEHPVDDHQWRTVSEVLSVIDPDSPEPWCAGLAEELGSLDELLVASLLHDVGKGRGGDHSTIGAGLVEEFGRRTGFGPAATAHMASAVRWHLVLPEVATRRDINDPAVVDEVASLINDPQLVRMLALLAVGDARATGHTVWSPWKASLVRTLTFRVLERLSPTASQEDSFEELMQALGDSDRGTVLRHVEAMGSGYLDRFDASEVRRHLAVAVPRPAGGRAVIDAEHHQGTTSLVIAAADRPGLLGVVAGVLALHGIGVLDARLLVSSDGVVLDTFHVSNARRPGRVSDHTLDLVSRDLSRVLERDLDLEAALSHRRKASHRTPTSGIAHEVRFSTDRSTGEDVIELRADDRPGLLHDIAATLFEAGLDIRLAKIETRGSRVIDVFYLRSPVDEPAELEKSLLARL